MTTDYVAAGRRVRTASEMITLFGAGLMAALAFLFPDHLDWRVAAGFVAVGLAVQYLFVGPRLDALFARLGKHGKK